MSYLLSLTEAQTLQALRAVLLQVLPAGLEVVRGQANRVPEVKAPDFVVMTPILRQRLETNIDSYADLAFTASIAGTVMTVTAVEVGTIAVDDLIAGPNLLTNTKVTALGTGHGGTGTYTVSPSQTAASGLVWGGVIQMLQPVKLTVQLDVHGPASADNAQIITTILRDAAGVDLFAATGFDVVPLYAGEPRQLPFSGEQQQVEERWSIDAVLQANPVVTTQQQFADALIVGLINVDATYPP